MIAIRPQPVIDLCFDNLKCYLLQKHEATGTQNLGINRI